MEQEGLSLTSNTSTIIYKVEVESFLKGNKCNPSNIHLNMPQSPQMSSNVNNSSSAITLIGIIYELYIKSLLIRGDIINSDLIAHFFELERHYSPDIGKICQLRRLSVKETEYLISDFYYDEANDIIFIGCGRKLRPGFNKDNMGQILVYKVNKLKSSGNSNQGNAFDQCPFELDTKSEVSKMNYYQIQCKKYLKAANYNGARDVFECLTYYSTYISFQFLKLLNTIQINNGQLLSFGFNIISHYLYSIPRKGKEISYAFIDSDSKKNTEKPITISSSVIIGFDYDESHNRFITLSDDGTIMALIITEDHNVKTLNLFKSSSNEAVSLFKVDYLYIYLYVYLYVYVYLYSAYNNKN